MNRGPVLSILAWLTGRSNTDGDEDALAWQTMCHQLHPQQYVLQLKMFYFRQILFGFKIEICNGGLLNLVIQGDGCFARNDSILIDQTVLWVSQIKGHCNVDCYRFSEVLHMAYVAFKYK